MNERAVDVKKLIKQKRQPRFNNNENIFTLNRNGWDIRVFQFEMRFLSITLRDDQEQQFIRWRKSHTK